MQSLIFLVFISSAQHVARAELAETNTIGPTEFALLDPGLTEKGSCTAEGIGKTPTSVARAQQTCLLSSPRAYLLKQGLRKTLKSLICSA